MNKREAKAILACQNAVIKAVSTCAKHLKRDELLYFNNYWGAHLLGIVNGHGYGSAPVDRAADRLELR